jgi:hypothetical protein
VVEIIEALRRFTVGAPDASEGRFLEVGGSWV